MEPRDRTDTGVRGLENAVRAAAVRKRRVRRKRNKSGAIIIPIAHHENERREAA
jgi:hypothetical protein